MMMDLTILKILKARDKYTRLINHVPMKAVDPKVAVILTDFGAYFKEFPDVAVIEAAPFTLWFTGFRHPGLKEEARSIYGALIKAASEDAPTASEAGLVNRLQAAASAHAMAGIVEKFTAGEEIDFRQQACEVIKEYDNATRRVDKSVQVLDRIEGLLEDLDNSRGFTFRLECLNRHIRPLRPGDFVIVAARVDKGKTTFVSSEMTHMAAQVDAIYPGQNRSILWLNNEGPGSRIVVKNFQSALNATMEELSEMAKQPPDAGFEGQDSLVRQKYVQALGGRAGVLRVMDVHRMSSDQVEDLIKQYPPAVIVFDMVDNVRFAGSTMNGGQRNDQVLETMYQWAREIAVLYDCVVIATSQLSADAHGLQWPTQTMLKDSKTGKQGAADLIITIGTVEDPQLYKSRYIGTTKNKLARTGVNPSPMTEVLFDGDRGRYKEYSK